MSAVTTAPRPARSKRRGVWRAARIVAGSTLTLAIAGGVILHLDLPATRHVAVRIANRALEPVFRGRITIESLGRLGLEGFSGARVRIDDPHGQAVLVADGVRAHVRLFELLRTLASSGALEIDIPEASVDHADLILDTDEAGTPLIQHALTPATAGQTSPRASGPPKLVRLVIARAKAKHVWLHGAPEGAPNLDLEASDVEGKVTVTSSGVIEIDVYRGQLVARSVPVVGEGHGTIHGRVRAPSDHGHGVGLDTNVLGSFGGLDAQAHFALDGSDVVASLDLRDVAPERVRALLPDYPVQDSLTAHLEAHGTFPDLDVAGRMQLRGGGSFATSGTVVLSAKKRATLHAQLAAVDLRALAPKMPVSSLGAAIDATLLLERGSVLTGAVKVATEGGIVADRILPAAEIEATFSSGERGPRIDGRVDADVTVKDPLLPATATVHLHPKGRSFEVAFSASARAPSLLALPPYVAKGVRAKGSVTATARGTASLESYALTAELGAEARGLEPFPGARIETATATVHVGGTVFVPRIDAQAQAESVDLWAGHADVANITALGPLSAPHVRVAFTGGNLPQLVIEGNVRPGPVTILQDVRAAFSRGDETAALRADTVRVGAAGLSAERVLVSGLGGPVHADIKVQPRALEVSASGSSVDLGRATRVVGLPGILAEGRASFEIEASVRGGTADGRVKVDVTDATVAGIAGTSAHAELTLKDRHLAGRAHAQLGTLGTLDAAATDLQMGTEGAASLRSWQRVWGGLEVHSRIDLARASAAIPTDGLPVQVVGGQLAIDGSVQRDSMEDDTPNLALSAKTTELVLQGALGPTLPETRGPSSGNAEARKTPWRLEGVDFGVDARIDGNSGFAEVAARATDAEGPIVAVDAKSAAMPYTALLVSPARARELLSQVHVDATIVFPSRDLAALPAALRPTGTEGEVGGELRARGTIASPEIELQAALRHGRASATQLSFPLDVDVAARYAGGRGDAQLTARTPRRGDVLTAEAHAEGNLPDVVAHPVQAAWSASGRAHLSGFPLGGVGFLEDRQVHGDVTGDVAVDGLHRDGSASADLTAQELQVGEVTYRDARVRLKLASQGLDASAHLDHIDGSADVRAIAGASWGDALTPSLAPERPVDFTFKAKNFRAETFLPFAHETLAELEGRLDGTVRVAYDPQKRATTLNGGLAYTKGTLELSSALGELHDASATLVLSPDGLVRLENASASGVTGRVEAAATARLTTGPRGLALGAARARVLIPKKTPLPLTLEGSPLGTVDGTIDVSEDPSVDGRRMAVVLDVPTLHVQLPQSGSRSLQPLGELDAAEIGAHLRMPVEGARALVPVALGPVQERRARAVGARRIDITTKLGNDVEVRRGTDLEVGLEGEPTFSITDKLRATGQIRLRKGGLLDVQGKSFEIEKGTVTFVGDDPDNPQVVVTAGWTAPDGTRIYADYVGPLKTGKVTLRSEPPLAQADIVALLLFGTAEGQSGGGGGQTATNSATGSAVGAAGNVATQPINHALDQFGVHALAARVDTSQSTNPKPEVELQIAKNISVQLAVVLGTPPPGVNPDTTLLTLKWRVLRAMTVLTTFGNSGSSIVDMVWDRRY